VAKGRETANPPALPQRASGEVLPQSRSEEKVKA